MTKVYIDGQRSFSPQEFEVGPFTIMFGKNNAGKTYLLEAVYLMLATRPPSAGEARIRDLENEDDLGAPVGAIYVELEPGTPFDDSIIELFPDWDPVEPDALRFRPLPPRQVCFSGTDRNRTELWFTDVREYYDYAKDQGVFMGGVELDDEYYGIDEQQRLDNGPFPEPLFLGWEFNDINTWVTSAMAALTTIKRVEHREDGAVVHYPTRQGWLEPADPEEAAMLAHYPISSGRPEPDSQNDPAQTWIVRAELQERLDQLTSLATDLLPDFLGGSIRAEFLVPTQWDGRPQVKLTYHERPNSDGHSLEYFGRGASRWMGIAVQIALRIMHASREITGVNPAQRQSLSGHVLFVDEPEAHLHHSAVASIVGWCARMVECGFHVMAASHHEEFLRASSDSATFIKVTRELKEESAWGWDPLRTWSSTTARTIPVRATSTLQELASEIGLHPAAALSLQRAILFVEGVLDVAVLDEYAGGKLDAAGVTLIPIHGTRNLEGLIDGEFTIRLGIKTGVLTDNSVIATMWDRSNSKRSTEEKKLIRLIKRFEDHGLPPPTPFGIPEDDLLFALPADAIRDYLGGPFPGWHQLREECRAAEGGAGSDSVDWKSYALERFGLPITTDDGVRRIIHALDLAGVELPVLNNVIEDIVIWATLDLPDST
jgi:hypothetical protein